jgi:hypothetical protein
MSKAKRDPDQEKPDVRRRRRGVVCLVCDNRPYKIPAGQLCKGCQRRRNTNFCPGCGGLPERVRGPKCEDCGTLKGKNPEYNHPPPSHGAVKMDGL